MGSFTDVRKLIKYLSTDERGNMTIKTGGVLQISNSSISLIGTIPTSFMFAAADGSQGANIAWSCNTTGFASDGAIKIQVGDTYYYVPFFTAAHTSGT